MVIAHLADVPLGQVPGECSRSIEHVAHVRDLCMIISHDGSGGRGEQEDTSNRPRRRRRRRSTAAEEVCMYMMHMCSGEEKGV